MTAWKITVIYSHAGNSVRYTDIQYASFPYGRSWFWVHWQFHFNTPDLYMPVLWILLWTCFKNCLISSLILLISSLADVLYLHEGHDFTFIWKFSFDTRYKNHLIILYSAYYLNNLMILCQDFKWLLIVFYKTLNNNYYICPWSVSALYSETE